MNQSRKNYQIPKLLPVADNQSAMNGIFKEPVFQFRSYVLYPITDKISLITKNTKKGVFCWANLLFFKSSAIYQKWSPQGNSKELPSYKKTEIIICSKAWKQKKGLFSLYFIFCVVKVDIRPGITEKLVFFKEYPYFSLCCFLILG